VELEHTNEDIVATRSKRYTDRRWGTVSKDPALWSRWRPLRWKAPPSDPTSSACVHLWDGLRYSANRRATPLALVLAPRWQPMFLLAYSALIPPAAMMGAQRPRSSLRTALKAAGELAIGTISCAFSFSITGSLPRTSTIC
jgi:hypothetical protein